MKLIPCVSGIRPLQLAIVAVLVGAVVLLVREGADRLRRQQDACAEEVRRGAEIEQCVLGVQRRVAEKERLVHVLLAGQLTLLEAAACFRLLDHEPPELDWKTFCLLHAGESDEERHCREVIDHVHAVLIGTDRDGADCICECLRAELRQHSQEGPLCLQELPPRLRPLRQDRSSIHEPMD
jgi:hypothetical protein